MPGEKITFACGKLKPGKGVITIPPRIKNPVPPVLIPKVTIKKAKKIPPVKDPPTIPPIGPPDKKKPRKPAQVQLSGPPSGPPNVVILSSGPLTPITNLSPSAPPIDPPSGIKVDPQKTKPPRKGPLTGPRSFKLPPTVTGPPLTPSSVVEDKIPGKLPPTRRAQGLSSVSDQIPGKLPDTRRPRTSTELEAKIPGKLQPARQKQSGLELTAIQQPQQPIDVRLNEQNKNLEVKQSQVTDILPDLKSGLDVKNLSQFKNAIFLKTATKSIDKVVISPNKIQKIIDRLAQKKHPDDPRLNAKFIGSVLYHPWYTFYKSKPSQVTTLVHNERFLHVFRSAIPIGVSRLLNRMGTKKEWSELDYNSISLDHIAASINPTLLGAFNVLHHSSGSKIPVDTFLMMIEKLLLTNRLDELDPSYFISLAEKHATIPKIEFQGFEVVNTADPNFETFAIGSLGEESTSSDAESARSDLEKQIVKRFKPGPKEMGATVDIELCDQAASSINLGFKGVPIDLCDETGEEMKLGSGTGVYIPIDDCENLRVKITQTSGLVEISAVRYVSSEIRELALTLLRKDPCYYLSVSSVLNRGEFDPTGTHTNQYRGQVAYFILDPLSIVETPTDNFFVINTKAKYKLETDTGIINDHVKDNGFAISRVNVDYRDNWHDYAIRGETIELEENDVNTSRVRGNPGLGDKVHLVKSLPAALVIVPGNGSRHNPYGGTSEVVDHKPIVTRRLGFEQHLDLNHLDFSNLALKAVPAGDSFGLGDVEEDSPDTQSLVFEYDVSQDPLKNTYYTEDRVTSSIPTDTNRPATGFLVNDIIEDVLKRRYTVDPAGLTWWDIYRRLPEDMFYWLDYDLPLDVYIDLENGWRNVKVREVLNKGRDEDFEETGLVAVKDSGVADATIYLNKEDRVTNAESYTN